MTDDSHSHLSCNFINYTSAIFSHFLKKEIWPKMGLCGLFAMWQACRKRPCDRWYLAALAPAGGRRPGRGPSLTLSGCDKVVKNIGLEPK